MDFIKTVKNLLSQRKDFQKKIDGIDKLLAPLAKEMFSKLPKPRKPSGKTTGKRKSTMSAAGRARIAAAQRKRHAEAKKAAAKTA